MEIISWGLFILSIVLSLATIALIYAVTSSYEEDSTTYFYLINFIFIGFTFLIARNLFNTNVSLWIWKGGNLLSIINLAICSLIRNSRIKIHWLITIFLSIIIAGVPFFLDANLIKDNNTTSLTDFNNNYPQILLTFWIPLLGLVLLMSLFYSIITSRTKNEQNRILRYLIERNLDKDDYRYLTKKEKGRYEEFENKMARNLYEEIRYANESNFRRYDELLARQRDLLETTLTKLKSEPKSSKTNLLIEDKNLIEIAKSVNDIKAKIELVNITGSNENLGLYSNSNNQNFIREIFHFLVTPLSQIETKAIIFSQDPKVFLKNGIQFNKAVSTIKTSVEICKSVLAAYRELAFVTSTSDWSPESLNQSILAAGNLYKESMEKEVNISCNITETLPPYSNNYLLAVILPLLENAIKASPPGKNIGINLEILHSKINIHITNEAINMPTVKHLNTPGFSSKKGHKGTGLLIARHLVEDQNKGSINFEIKDNVITTTISLPQTKTI